MMTRVFDFYEIKPGHFISLRVTQLAWAWLDLVNWKLTESLLLPFIIKLQGVKQYGGQKPTKAKASLDTISVAALTIKVTILTSTNYVKNIQLYWQSSILFLLILKHTQFVWPLDKNIYLRHTRNARENTDCIFVLCFQQER